MNQVRTVVIGFGGMGSQYVQMIHDGEVDSMRLAGVCCRGAKGQGIIREKYPEAAVYPNVEDTFAHAEAFDAVVIATPHATHVEIGKMAAKAGKHILMDKPAGVFAGEARELIDAADQAGVSFGMIFNNRMKKAYQKAEQLVKTGVLGRLDRGVWICNPWFRTPAYHRSAQWRSTWAGEHGGLLINQCQHNLDIWQWILGMPDRVRAFIDYGKYSEIEVDDSFTMQLFYRSGFSGTIISSSGENPGVNRLEIWGTKGRLCVEDASRVTFDENRISTVEFAETNTEPYGKLDHTLREIPIEAGDTRQYQQILENFASHILEGTPLCANGFDGMNTVMIANGAYLSSWLGRPIDLPINEQLYQRLLMERAEGRG